MLLVHWYMFAGGWNKFESTRGFNDWLPGWLRRLGYTTGLVGKFMNGFQPTTATCPPDWDHFETFVRPSEYDLRNPCFLTNCLSELAPDCPGRYQTLELADRTKAFLRRAVGAGKPFFTVVTPTAPHQDNSGRGFKPPVPEPKYADLYPGVSLVCLS